MCNLNELFEVFYITKATGKLVDRFILIGEITTLVGFLIYFLTDWLDQYRDRLFFALFLLLGVSTLLHGFRCKQRIWSIVGVIGGGTLIVTIILYATSLNFTVLEYSPIALALGALFALLSLILGTSRDK